MYSLIVSHQVESDGTAVIELSRARFLEYTSEPISSQLDSLSVEAMACLKSWPCLLMKEGRGSEEVGYGRITAIEFSGSEVKVTVSVLQGTPPLSNVEIWRLRAQLDIGDFEFNRNHWAIKDRDLFPVMTEAGHVFGSGITSQFTDKPLPAPSRRELVNASSRMAMWSHAEVDAFLLEAGVKGLSASRSLGSCRERSTAIVAFAIEKPASTTAENSLFSAFILRKVRARPADRSTPRAGRRAAVNSAQAVSTPGKKGKRRAAVRSPNRVFVVHGHNEAAMKRVVRLLARVGLSGIVLHEQPNMGRHLLTKFIEEADLVTFAIVVMTDDDRGCRAGATPGPRARQNVILELGYFLSHLGQQRVCALITPGLETPSDFDGIVYISMDSKRNWEAKLISELRAAEMPLTK